MLCEQYQIARNIAPEVVSDRCANEVDTSERPSAGARRINSLVDRNLPLARNGDKLILRTRIGVFRPREQTDKVASQVEYRAEIEFHSYAIDCVCRQNQLVAVTSEGQIAIYQ